MLLSNCCQINVLAERNVFLSPSFRKLCIYLHIFCFITGGSLYLERNHLHLFCIATTVFNNWHEALTVHNVLHGDILCDLNH